MLFGFFVFALSLLNAGVVAMVGSPHVSISFAVTTERRPGYHRRGDWRMVVHARQAWHSETVLFQNILLLHGIHLSG